MSRFSQYDTDEERLPEGMQRVGYDADTETYTFRDADGSYWESAPGNRYGRLTRVGDASAHDDHDEVDPEAFLLEQQQAPSWRHDMMPLLNFGILVFLALFGLFWFLHWKAGDEAGVVDVQVKCERPYTVLEGDTCWDISGGKLEELTGVNEGLDCEKLLVGETVCLPVEVAPV